ncbi:TfoX N-terminal domain protein [Leptospira inadai serovar Lyme str. 10]|uniref:TfoX N-terminal domain protein n=2 Tax=Leptospira inadai serovar Lyme TaxID=293084 RepID=V6HCC0_9LEPT|nr:TfoX/Sxy family protein [Leptospira inadai]EQA37486.1 TfoX N-terminal domain protein [Leptospira inadai serovar Lyme str. 10]PNV73598.1 hypothetical protein BES34_016960 [Leptospira inadai serovar Lyme]
MAYSETLAIRVRAALPHIQNLEEKKMFRGICFMVNDKMCVCVANDELMCRIDPDIYDSVLEKKKCRPMIHNGKVMKGFVFVDEKDIKSKKEFQYWIDLALDFNGRAKASPKRKKKKVVRSIPKKRS